MPFFHIPQEQSVPGTHHHCLPPQHGVWVSGSGMTGMIVSVFFVMRSSMLYLCNTAHCCRGIPQRVISGTSLAAVATTGATAGYVYWSSGSVDTRYAGLLAAGAVLTAPFGARATHLFNCHVSVWGLLWYAHVCSCHAHEGLTNKGLLLSCTSTPGPI
jgi:hypothetical protein